MVVSGTRLDPVGDQLDGGRGGVDDRGHDGGEPGRAEQRQHRDQVDERAGWSGRRPAAGAAAVSTRVLRAIHTPRTTAEQHHQQRWPRGSCSSVIIASCHRSKYQMPAMQMTVGTSGSHAAEHRGDRGDGQRRRATTGDSASSACSGLSSAVGDEVLERAGRAVEDVTVTVVTKESSASARLLADGPVVGERRAGRRSCARSRSQTRTTATTDPEHDLAGRGPIRPWPRDGELGAARWRPWWPGRA